MISDFFKRDRRQNSASSSQSDRPRTRRSIVTNDGWYAGEMILKCTEIKSLLCALMYRHILLIRACAGIFRKSGQPGRNIRQVASS